MFKNKLISVIMPVYNAEEYIRDAIESILSQTYINFEFIIINDGSIDGSLDIINEYMKKDNRIVLISRGNKGIVKSLNDGIHYANGEYIARMDADDISHPKRFEKQVNYLNEHIDIFLLGTNFNMLYEENISVKCKKEYESMHARSREPIDRNNMFLSISEGTKFVHPTIMLRRETFDIVGEYRNYTYEDIELYFRIGKNGLGIAKLEDDLLSYRGRDSSKSSTDNMLNWKSEILQMKIQYLLEQLDDSFRKVKYLIWGADISGDLAYSVLYKMLPDSECIAYIDPKKDGELNGFPIIIPSTINNFKYDYVFICTQAGAKSARELLRKLGKVETEDFFKIS